MKRFGSVIASVMLAMLTAPTLAQTTPPPGPGLDGPPMAGRMGDRHGGMARPVREAVEKMSPEGRAIIRQSMKDAMPDAANRQAMEQARSEIVRLMSVEPLDAAAMRRAMAREREIAGQAQASRHEAMLTALLKLSPADRKLYAAGWREAAERGRNWKERMKERREQRQEERPR
jgi:uncharacterized membrane protein